MPHSALMEPRSRPSSAKDYDLSMLPATNLFRRTCASLRSITPGTRVSRASTCRKTIATPGMHNGVGNDEASATTTAPAYPTINLAPVATDKKLENDVVPAQSLSEQCERVHRRVYELLAREPATERVREVQRQTKISLEVIGEALKRYSLEELSLSYNGGKDCLVLLILYLAALHSHVIGQQSPSADSSVTLPLTPPRSQTRTPLPQTLPSVYIVSPNPFPQVTSFVEQSSAMYHLSLAHYVKPMKEAFAAYLHDYPSVRAIFVGTRRTDPHGAKLTHFDPTDGGWPTFMRIHPVIDWHYADIWTFIKEVGVEYCELYDMGYTSLGGTNDTHPNPVLQVRNSISPDGKIWKYRPAYELIEDEEERLGRDR